LHHASAAEHVVTVPSQLREVAGTLVQELTGVQLKVVTWQVVVHDVANSGVVRPRKMAAVVIGSSAARIKSLLLI